MSESEIQVLLLAGRFEVRGSSTYTLRLAAGLRQQGIAAMIVTPDARLIDATCRSQIQIREFPRLDAPPWSWLVKRLVLRELRAQPPRLIHIQSHRVHATGRWLARQIDCPYVLTVHEHLRPRSAPRLDARRCRRLIVVSQSVGDALVENQGLPAELITVIPPGVETSPPAGLPPPLEPGHVPVIGTAGPLETVKGLPYFLGAARQVLDVREGVEFLVAGAGPEEANLRRVARELGITGKVTFVPNVACFREALAATDIFCLPSLQQGLGTIMLEAMALGRPVIATGVGGVASVIRDGQTGLIVPPKNSSELARRMLELLDNPPRARAIGGAARRLVVEDFNIRTMVEKTSEVYRRSVDAAAPA